MNGTVDYTVLENEQFEKLDPGSRGNMLFKPSKKMKKRRQLDALVSNGKKLPRRKQSGHELLRSNDSDSSEVEEFSVLDNQTWGRRWPGAGCCSTCYTLTCVLIVASCVLASGALIWMHLQLKHEFSQLRDRVDQVENKNAGAPEEFQALKAKLVSVNKTVNDLKTGTYGLDTLNKTIISMQKQITSLTATATELQKTVQDAEPDDKEQVAVAKTVADLGSSLQSTQGEVSQLKTDQQSLDTQLKDLSDKVAAILNPGGRETGSSPIKANDMQDVLSQINASYSESIALALANMDKQEARLAVVDKFAGVLGDQVKNSSETVANLTTSLQQLWQLVLSQQDGGVRKESEGERSTAPPLSLTQLQAQITQLQRWFQQMQTAYTNFTQTSEGAHGETGPLDIENLQKDHEQFLAFKTEVYSDITALNASLGVMNGSVGVLNTDVGDLFVKVGLAMSDISNLTSVVEGLADILQTRADKADALAGNTSTLSHLKSTTLPPSNDEKSEGDTSSHSSTSNEDSTAIPETASDNVATADKEPAT